MRVAFDTTFLNRPPSGIGAYVAALRTRLPHVSGEIEIVEIAQPESGFWSRIGTRPGRFGWETLGSGLAARGVNVDLVHMPMMARPLLPGSPVVVTVHDVIPFVMPEYRASRAMQVNLAVARQTLRFARTVIAPSMHAADDINRVLGFPRDRIHVTYEAADDQYQPLGNANDFGDDVLQRHGISGTYLFNVGGLDVRKNLPVLIRSFAEVIRAAHPDLRLVIAGAEHADNPAVYPSLRPLIAELGLESRVVMTGRISEEDKVALIQRASIYVTPSLYEGFGLTALEAMACGVPVIASNRTSLPEVVGDAGILVEPRVPELTVAIDRLLDDAVLRSDIAGRGLERSKQFSWDKTARETADVYRQTLGLKD